VCKFLILLALTRSDVAWGGKILRRKHLHVKPSGIRSYQMSPYLI
jgi:hypothetical protein